MIVCGGGSPGAKSSPEARPPLMEVSPIARYRVKDDVDLGWNALRRAATARIDLKYKTLREHELNEVLGQLWAKYAHALSRGEVIELEPEYETWLRESLPMPQGDEN